MDARQQRGLAIAAAARIEKNRLGWKVPSQSGKGSYMVTLEGEPFCTCPDFENRGGPCKHVLAVQYTLQRETTKDGTTTLTESVRVTFSQNWPAYNDAQRNEKAEFMRLLSDLCALIPEPPQTIGRPRLSLAEMVFSAALKVYSTVSGRRFMGDLDTAHEKGYVSKVPHYNSIFNYLENPDLTPIIKSLIEISGVPLKSIESVFAPDSSGFSTSRFDRWFDEKYGRIKSKRQWLKAHIMTGVKTNIVTAVEVTPSNVNDSPMLEPLAYSTAQSFHMSEVPGDKAYLSEHNLAIITSYGATPFIPFKSNTTGKGSQLWMKTYHYFMLNRDEFMEHYHQRSNVETTFSMIKGKFGDSIRSKTGTGQINEILLKVLCHNICCLILAVYELKVNPIFWADCPKSQSLAQKVGT
jgi:hypothetical protein